MLWGWARRNALRSLCPRYRQVAELMDALPFLPHPRFVLVVLGEASE